MKAILRSINWRLVFVLACFCTLLLLGSIGWGVVVHWLAHCS